MLPPPIVSNEPGSFPHRVLAERHPALLAQVRAGHPYGRAQHRALDDLEASITAGLIPPVPAGLGDAERWQGWNAQWAGQNWFDVPFLVAENFFYRHLLDATGHFASGPWHGTDPFAQLKAAELTAVDVAGAPDGPHALLAAVWGNQADLGFRVTADLEAARGGASTMLEAGLVADDSDRLWDRLRSGPAGTVVLVADNAGRELLADLLLADHLLTAGLAARVALHVKPSPYFVSDATTADVVACVQALGPAGAGLKAAAARDRLTIATHAFYFSPLTYRELPGDLAQEYRAARVVLLKGDLNYRRLVGDAHWDPRTGFADATAYFPGWVAALRTLKSDVVVGLDGPTLDRLEATGDPWRTSGHHALVQTSGPAGPA